MRPSTLIAPLALFTSFAASSPLARRQDATGSGFEPCELVQLLVAQYNSTPGTAGPPLVPAAAAWNCINSVPLNTTAALELVRSVKPFARWQSTTAILPSLPAEYAQKIQAPFDSLGALDDIEKSLLNGKWTKEYDFGIALYEAFHQVHDGHYYFNPDVVGAIFNWARDLSLVSVSEDGNKLPAPFVYADILAASAQGANITFTPSAISKIDGEDAKTWLETNAQIGSLQDKDALYNTNFYILAQVALGSNGIGAGLFAGGGRGRLIYPGATTTLDFANGTQLVLKNKAKVLVDFNGIKTGRDLYNRYFAYPDLSVELEKFIESGKGLDDVLASVPALTSSSAQTLGDPAAAAAPPPGYPQAIVREPNNLISGYYLPDSDVAVLSVPSFVSLEESEIPFQQTGSEFLALAVRAGKTKLIIDVSANAGGTILQGYDLFKQLFPLIDAYAAADRVRAFESTDLVGESFSNEAAKYPRSFNNTDEVVNLLASFFNAKSDFDADTGLPFTSWSDKFGPERHQNDKFTSRFRWNLADPLIRYNSGGIDVHGYGALANYTFQPFLPENIVIVYDGYCASTCTIFSELMRRLVGIKAIAMGGRSNAEIIQAGGGTKGTNNLGWDYIQYQVETAVNISAQYPELRAKVLDSELMEYDNYLPLYRSTGGATGINFRDGIRKDDATNTPLQFVYEPADCRLFYTAEMTVDASAIWKKAADVTWGGQKCVAGGFGGETEGTVGNALSSTGVGGHLLENVNLSEDWIGRLRDGMRISTNPRFWKGADGIMYP